MTAAGDDLDDDTAHAPPADAAPAAPAAPAAAVADFWTAARARTLTAPMPDLGSTDAGLRGMQPALNARLPHSADAGTRRTAQMRALKAMPAAKRRSASAQQVLAVFPATAPAEMERGVWPASDHMGAERERDWWSFLGAYAAGSWDPARVPLQPTPDAQAAFPFPSMPRTASLVDSSLSSGPPSSDQWSKLSSSTTPSSSASAAAPIAARVDAGPAAAFGAHVATLAARRGTQAPDLSHAMPLRSPLTRSTDGHSPYPLGRPRLKASSSSPGLLMEDPPEPDPDPEVIGSRAALAATMRWAGMGMSIAPLALPSPEYELTDPMRNYAKSLPPLTPSDRGEPSTYPSHRRAPSNASSTGDAARVLGMKLRERGFWEGTTEVSPDQLPPIPGSTEQTPDPQGWRAVTEAGRQSPSVRRTTSSRSLRTGPRDYFSLTAPPPPPRPAGNDSEIEDVSASSGRSSPSIYETPAPWETPAMGGPTGIRPTAGLVKPGKVFQGSMPMSVLKLPPLPTIPSPPDATEEQPPADETPLPPQPPPPPPSALHRPKAAQHSISQSQSVSDDSAQTIAAGSPALPDSAPRSAHSQAHVRMVRPSIRARAMTETPAAAGGAASGSDEEMDVRSAFSNDVWSGSMGQGSGGVSVPPQQLAYLEQGYLPAPSPVEELPRLRALYQHNILHTGPDMNFERLVNLVKLVFRTKVVTISLVDATKEWFKSELGMHVASISREESFCAHAILQKQNEPLVVLNAAEDWRFANNPLVTESPGVRFYVAAQLRTQDGYNIGALTIADDEPRAEFTPRQRHTLTEFAGVVMREIVMWRDKIRLRVRDRIQSSMEQMTRECLETPGQPQEDEGKVTRMETKMAMIFDYSAKIIKRTLEVEGVMVLDVVNADIEYMKPPQESAPVNQLSLISYSAEQGVPPDTKLVSVEDYAKIREYLLKHAHGRMVDERVPALLRGLIPSDIKYGLLVPLIDVDKRLFALLCAYNTTHRVQPFDGHELSYLRAIGVIILCAMLQQRMVQADRTKTLFISNISHELRTPLHGIVAATELLMDSPMDQHQTAILRTIQACGNILTETVNHVLDFSKHAKASQPEDVDLVQLIEMAVEGCWLGFRSRTSSTGGTDIQRVYSSTDRPNVRTRPHVETVIDIDHRAEGWDIKCDKSGIQRVLINLVGNSLKFTTDGNVHVALRELHGVSTAEGRIRVELKVSDTGKGISKEFLKHQLFHPFSQENPMQQGTGLGLAIVKNIVHSKNVNGTVDVWSTEGVGTGIRVVMDVELVPRPQSAPEFNICAQSADGQSHSISFSGFSESLKGEALLLSVLQKYVETWWGFTVAPDGDDQGDILVINEDTHVLQDIVDRRLVQRPVVFLTSFRKDPVLVNAVTAFEQYGGYCRAVYKPVGPRQLFHALHGAVPALSSSRSPREPSQALNGGEGRSGLTPPRVAAPYWPSTTLSQSPTKTSSELPTGTSDKTMRVLIMEDNTILRNLLVRWATLRGYYCQAADDGEQGVEIFQSSPTGNFDVVLLDVTMPRMDGIQATKSIRAIEARRASEAAGGPVASPKSTIVALTGMSSEQDKERAYNAGVNQYLVKPVSLKTLDDILHSLLKMAKASEAASS